MARKKALGKTSALSEEYVIDSDSDGQASVNLGIQRESNNGHLHKFSKKPEKGCKASTKATAQKEQRGKADSVDEESEATERSVSRAESSSSDEESQNGASVQTVHKPPKKKAAATYEVNLHIT